MPIEREVVAAHFDALAAEYEAWKEKAHYYYAHVMEGLRHHIPPGRRVVEIGCGTGAILDSLKPSDGLGIDVSPNMVERARRKRPHLRFAVGDVETLTLPGPVDHLVMVDLVEHLADLRKAFHRLGEVLPRDATLVSSSANPLWAPILDLAERLGMKMPEGDHRWPSAEELQTLADEAGLATVTVDRRLVLPKRLPFLSDFVNAHFPRHGVLGRLNLIQVLVFQHRPTV